MASPARAPKPRHHPGATADSCLHLTGGARRRPRPRRRRRRRGGVRGRLRRGTADVGRRRAGLRSPPTPRRRRDSPDVISAAPSSRCPLRRRRRPRPGGGARLRRRASHHRSTGRSSTKTAPAWRTLLDGENHYVAALHQLRGQALVVGAPRLVRMVKAFRGGGARAPTAEEVRLAEDARRAALPTAGFCPTTGAALTGATLTGAATRPSPPSRRSRRRRIRSKRRCRQSAELTPYEEVGDVVRPARRRSAPTEEAVSTPMNASRSRARSTLDGVTMTPSSSACRRRGARARPHRHRAGVDAHAADGDA